MEGMNTKSIIMSVVAIAVAVLVVVTCAIPIFTSATETERTFTNEGLWRMKEIEDGDVWTRTTENGWSYGDTNIVLPTGQSGSNVLLGDDWCIRYVGHLRSTGEVNKSTNLNNATVTAGEEVIIASKTDSVWTANLNYPGYGADPEGDYTLTAFGSTSYVKGDTVIYGSGVSNVADTQIFVHVTATVDDGATFVISQSTGQAPISDVVITNATVNYSEVSGYEDLYKVESVTCDVSYNATIEDVSTPQTGTVTFSSYIVPYEVTAELSVHPTDIQITLISIIPILMVLGIIVAAVGMFLRSRA